MCSKRTTKGMGCIFFMEIIEIIQIYVVFFV
nr:MAG TPA: hypothetical protein [Caudoviricetes sp.]